MSDPAERYRRVKSLYLEVRELPPGERRQRLADGAGGDPSIAAEVMELLACETEPGWRGGGAGAAGGSAPILHARPGERIGPYEVESLLGAGGMAVVYKARDTRLDRPVALKFLAPSLTASPRARRRFEREARAASALDHANICTLYDIGESDGRTWLAMAYYAGESLDELLAAGPLPLDRALSIVFGVARGLAAAHRRGIVHRDVKPANVVLTEEGEAKLLDFGIAVLADQAPLTVESATAGTPGYMAPEQVRGEAVGPPADVWALGALAYELLAGRPPFEGDSSPALLYAALHLDPPPLDTLRPEVPPWLARTVRRCLAKEPEGRPADAGALVAELAAGAAAVGAAGPAAGGVAGEDAGGVAGEDAGGATAGGGRRARVPGRRRQGEAGTATAAAAGGRRWRRLAPWAAGLLVAAAAALFTLFGPTTAQLFARPTERIDSLAVLPFAHPPGDEELAALAGGLAERITHNLSRLDGLSVIAHSSAVRLSANDAPDEAAERLGVSAVVVGRLDRRGAALSVGAELVDAATGRQLWGDRFDELPADLIRLERELSREIAGALGSRLTPGDRRRLDHVGTRDAEAHRLLLQGLHHKRQMRYDEAREALAAAAAHDPGYAAAWAALGSVAAYTAFFGRAEPERAYAEARRAAERALALDPDLAEAWATRAQVRFFAEGDLAGALADNRRALALDPASAPSLYQRGALLIAADRPGDALAALERALSVDPLSPEARMMQGRAHLRRGDLSAAAAVSREGLALHPGFEPARRLLVRALTLAGDVDAARREAAAGGRSDDGFDAALLAGRRAEAERLLAEREAAWRELAGGPRAAATAVGLAFDHARLGDRAAALGWMEAAAGQPGSRVALLQLLPDPEIDFLRDDPRFRRLLAAIDAAPSFAAAAGAAAAGPASPPGAEPGPSTAERRP